MFLASGRAGVVRVSLSRRPNMLRAEFLDVADVESWCDERGRLRIASAIRTTSRSWQMRRC